MHEQGLEVVSLVDPSGWSFGGACRGRLNTTWSVVQGTPLLTLQHDRAPQRQDVTPCKMNSRDLRILFRETRLNLDPAPSFVVPIQIPSPGINRRAASHRAQGGATSIADEERLYRAKALATASSLYHRKHRRSPKSFLWRVLENETVLSIRVADVCKQRNESNASLVLNLQFANPIRSHCLDFADPVDHDALCVFVVDHVNQLYSITLRPDMFRKRNVAESGIVDACKVYSPPSFGLKHPFRLAAVDADQVIVAMHDGGILRFDRNRAHGGE